MSRVLDYLKRLWLFIKNAVIADYNLRKTQ